MRSEKQKMLAGELYDCSDYELANKSLKAYELCLKYNALPKADPTRKSILRELLPNLGENSFLTGPIFFDYGENFYTGKNMYANYNFVVMDCAKITIGNNVMFGPNVTLAAPRHPLDAEERRIRIKPDGSFYDYEFAKEIKIGSDCWIASNVIICGGVTIGDRTVIGAGSVVTRSLPSDVLAAGNPCKVIRKITEEDCMMK